MSQHLSIARTSRGRPAYVVAGWDRPLSEFFIRAFHGSEPNVNKMRHMSSGYSDLDSLEAALHYLQLTVPSSFMLELYVDARCGAGNRIVRHDFSLVPRVLYAEPDSSDRMHALFRARRPISHSMLSLQQHERMVVVQDKDQPPLLIETFRSGRPFGLGGLIVTNDDFELILSGPCDERFCAEAFGRQVLPAAA